ncbi:hypothetical protein AMECASPLE_035128 [Ameca splendens]|uniref:Uncharacterized protein n=1 Tax=Ameca splendens TaxID=208324 RepID=A0ABV0Z681_9TELE
MPPGLGGEQERLQLTPPTLDKNCFRLSHLSGGCGPSGPKPLATKTASVSWCDAHQLHINIDNTVKMLVDPRSVGDHLLVAVHGHDIWQVNFICLGVHIDNDLSVCTDIVMIFYRATAESI